MARYLVKFEFKKPGASDYMRWSGGFSDVDPRALRNNIHERLQLMGYEVGGIAVYEGEWLVVGAILSRPLESEVPCTCDARKDPCPLHRVYH